MNPFNVFKIKEGLLESFKGAILENYPTCHFTSDHEMMASRFINQGNLRLGFVYTGVVDPGDPSRIQHFTYGYGIFAKRGGEDHEHNST